MSKTFTVQPVETFPAYYVAPGGKVFGVPEDASVPNDLQPISFICNVEEKEIEKKIRYHYFFIIDGSIYFSVSHFFPSEIDGEEGEAVTMFCRQSKGKITYLDESKFPDVPEPVRIEAKEGDYTFSISEYEGEPISMATRDYNEPFGFIDGYLVVDGGCLIHAQVGRGSARRAGLLFWPEGVRRMNWIKDPGRFYRL